MQSGRGTEGGSYRYGFNGKETDPETDIQDYGMRWYLPNIARFPSVDPLEKSYPWNSVYAFSEGDPINYIDLDGLEQPTNQAQVYKESKNAPTFKPLPSSTIIEEGVKTVTKSTKEDIVKSIVKRTSIRSQIITGLKWVGTRPFAVVGFLLGATEAHAPTLSQRYNIYGTDTSPDKYQEKREKRADKYMEKRRKMEPNDNDDKYILYKLEAREDGIYPCASCPASQGGSIFLKKGEVWKYGITSKESVKERYSGAKFSTGEAVLARLEPVTIKTGQESEIKMLEKKYTVSYYYHIENIARELRMNLRLHRPPGQSRDK